MDEVHPERNPRRQNINDDEAPNVIGQRIQNQISDREQDHVLESQEVMLERDYPQSALQNMNQERERDNRDYGNIGLRHLPLLVRPDRNNRERERRVEVEDLPRLFIPHSENSEISHSDDSHQARYDNKDAYEVIANGQ